jgi:hypothetical protein
MLFSLMADLVVVVHLGFLVFVGTGSVLLRRRPWLRWLHAPSVIWAVAGITIGLPCPLTSLEKLLRGWAGDGTYEGGFVDRYVEGVLIPESLTPSLRAMAMVAIVVGYAGLYRTRHDHWRRSKKAVAAARPFS